MTWLTSLDIDSDVMAKQKADCMKKRNVRHLILLDLKLLEQEEGRDA